MTCVLSMPVFHQNQYNENVTLFKYLDFNWMMNGCHQFSFVDNEIHCSNKQVDTDKDFTKLCQMEHSDEISGKVTHGQNSVLPQKINGTQLNTIFSDKQNPLNGNKDLIGESSICIGPYTGQIEHESTKIGVKRKVVIKDCDEVYIPSKRVSPFLNTSKEKKDERKTVLKVCMNKIKELEDPEIFLRRSVLVNNLTKRLQTELRYEKHVSRKFGSYKGEYFSDYKVLNNNCISDIFLCDDLFLCGTHEAITDDMTDTLINNVLSENK